MNKIDEILNLLELNNTLDIPVRRKGLTGSGKYNQCHSNVLSLVQYYGGNRLTGYIKNPFQGYFGFTHYISHSVWKTPEGKFADVTAHHYSKDKMSNALYPVAQDNTGTLFLPEFLISNTSSKKEMFVSYREVTESVKNSQKLEEIIINNIVFLKLPYKKIEIKNLVIRLSQLDGLDWINYLNYGDFKMPSTATGKEWVMIQKDYSRLI